MEPLDLKETEFTPRVLFDPESQVFEISGVSRPEHVMAFYNSPINWLLDFEKKILDHINAKYQVTTVQMIFKLIYFNSASAKSVLQILNILKSFNDKKDIKVIIDWYYDEGDEQMREDGEDLSEAIEIPFNYIEIED